MPASYPYSHSFAKYFLKQNNLRIRTQDKKILFQEPILPKDLPEFFYTEYKEPKLKVGSFEKSISIINISYQDLMNYGFAINSYATKHRTFFGQKRIYKIRPVDFESENMVKQIPPDHDILYDKINNAFLLKGRASDNEWVYKDGIKKREQEKVELTFEDKLRLIRGLKIEKKEITELKNIEGIPVGISWDRWKLVCIPISKNPPVIGCVGQRGKSKSICTHMIVDFLYNSKKRIGLFNDWKYETHTWCLPTNPHNSADFINRLNKLDLIPNPLPTVYFSPATRTKDKILKQFGEDEGIAYEISLSFKDVLKNYNSFFQGFKEFELGKSKTAFNFDDLEDCETEEEVISKIDDKITKDNRAMIEKIKRTMNFLFEQKLCDINNKKVPSKLILEKMDTITNRAVTKTEPLNPIIACMAAGLIPVFLPKKLLSIQFGKTSVLPSYMNYIVQEIYNIKNETKHFGDNDIYLVFDELTTITERGVNQPIKDVVNLGRTLGIGVVWAAQSYSKVLEDVKVNTNYLFCMQQDNTGEINEICKNYGSPDLVKDEIKNLSKEMKHECYIFASDPLLTYDLSTGKEEYWYEPIKIQLTPPMSMHAMRSVFG